MTLPYEKRDDLPDSFMCFYCGELGLHEQSMRMANLTIEGKRMDAAFHELCYRAFEVAITGSYWYQGASPYAIELQKASGKPLKPVVYNMMVN